MNALDDAVFGAYALLFYASLLATQIAALLVFGPTEILATERPVAARLTGLRATVRRGARYAALAAGLAGLGAVPAVGDVDSASLMKLILGAIAFAFLTPIQDHIRSMLHVSDRSSQAAAVSLVQLAALVVGALVLHQVDPVLVPFFALAIANLISGAFGLVRVGRAGRGQPPDPKEIRGIGPWLLAAGAANTGFSLFSSLILERFIGLGAIGLLEAARVVARPVQVVGHGFNAIFAPRSREAVA